jgi:DnaJ family protein B protein 13
MGRDYYTDLGLTRSATEVDIKKAYRKLALKYHPDKDETAHAATVFAGVAEAYDVLSNPRNKGFYDLYGEEGLKRGVTDGKGGRRGGFYEFSQAPVEVFNAFFGTDNPYKALNEIAEAFEAMTATPKLKMGKAKRLTVSATLEEIFHGKLKKVQHTRKSVTADKKVTSEERTLTIDIQAGIKTGTQFVFEGEGNQAPGMEPGPVVFTLSIEKHSTFERNGADLIFTAKLPLVHALCGTDLSIQTLDQTARTLVVPVSNIVRSGETLVVEGEGLPIGTGACNPDGTLVRGDLIVVFDLLFPQQLNDDQKMLLTSAFFLPPKPSKEQTLAVKTYRKSYMDTLKGWSAGFRL